jgi:hypothetical protein
MAARHILLSKDNTTKLAIVTRPLQNLITMITNTTQTKSKHKRECHDYVRVTSRLQPGSYKAT